MRAVSVILRISYVVRAIKLRMNILLASLNLGQSLAKNKSSQSVCIAAICRSGRRRSVAVNYGVEQLLKQCDIECSSARLSRHEWPKRTCNEKCDGWCHESDRGREMANSATDNMVSFGTESFEKFSAPPPPVPETSAKQTPWRG
eukprot:179929-Pyramimonas_sp.AAC.1